MVRGWRWVASEPGAAARLWLRKGALFWNGQELPNHLHFDFLREAAPALWLMPLTFAWIAPLGLYRLLSGRPASASTRRPRRCWR